MSVTIVLGGNNNVPVQSYSVEHLVGNTGANHNAALQAKDTLTRVWGANLTDLREFNSTEYAPATAEGIPERLKITRGDEVVRVYRAETEAQAQTKANVPRKILYSVTVNDPNPGQWFDVSNLSKAGELKDPMFGAISRAFSSSISEFRRKSGEAIA